MDKIEELMSAYPALTFIFDNNMPDGHKGLYIDDHIYLNTKQTREQLISTLGEEIGHHLTSAGNITKLSTNEQRKQEQRARNIGAILVVTPSGIVDCFENGCKTTLECANHLEVTKEVFETAISYYSTKFDDITVKDKYKIYFNENGSVGILKIF